MGYTTSFVGSFAFSRELTDQEYTFIDAFCKSRRMKWDVTKLQQEFGGKHGNPFNPEDPYGPDGAYFAIDDGMPSYSHPSVAEFNSPPKNQPGIWCDWAPTKTSLEWNGAEKFYNYVEWLEYLIEEFFAPWGVSINGAVQWEGEDPCDVGVISVCKNCVHVQYEEATDSDKEND